MPRKDTLLQLINSLTPAEKRNFSIYTNLFAGEKRYLKLFEILQGKQDYVVNELCRDLNLKPQQLADDKYYLNEVLLKSLQTFNPTVYDADILYNDLIAARVLINRFSFLHALTILDKAITRARQIERFEIMHSLLNSKHACLFHLNRIQDALDLITENKAVSKILAELIELRELELEVKLVEARRYKMPEHVYKQVARLEKKKPESMLCISAASYRFRILIYYYSLQTKGAEALKIVRQEFEYYKKHPSIKDFDPINYLLNIGNLAGSETSARNFERALQVYDKFIEVVNEPGLKCSPEHKARFQSVAHVLRIQTLFYLKKMDVVVSEMAKIFPMENYTTYYQYNLIFKYAAALVHQQRSAEAIDIINYLQQINTDQWANLQGRLKALIIIAQIELGNTQLVPYLVKSSKVWMKRKKYSDSELDLFFSYINAVAKPLKAASQKKAYQPLLKAIQAGKLVELDDDIGLGLWVNAKCK